jgi:hypothetical protein
VSGPKTHEEAVALPEVLSTLTEEFSLGSQGIGGDTICLFIDDDGIQKKVECIRRGDGPDEWVKSPL